MIGNKEKGIFPSFVLWKTLKRNPEVDIYRKNRIYLEWSFAITLFIISFLFISFQRVKKSPPVPITTINTVFNQVDIPKTFQGGLKLPRQPEKPALPIESEMEEMAEDVTIEFPEKYIPELPFDIEGFGSGLGSGAGSGSGRVSAGPRPISEHFPRYLKSAQEKGQKGTIELMVKINEKGIPIEVKVLRNTTGSKDLEKEAIKATMKSRYQPAMHNGKPITVWVTRTYTFGID
ncbi:hypothetical protein DRQ09_05260 [candidate division KSB1 bacterium]|nr:MAG: hypothetical protein DRQ09_05260 [candidate division KSB1 bacterium]